MSELVVRAECSGLRRTLGPTAWVVLEELALAPTTNVRDLARRLDLNKDTVAGALGRLIAAGIVTRQPQRADGRGRFRPAGYTLRLSAGLRVIQATPKSPTPNPSRTQTDQLTLLTD